VERRPTADWVTSIPVFSPETARWPSKRHVPRGKGKANPQQEAKKRFFHPDRHRRRRRCRFALRGPTEKHQMNEEGKETAHLLRVGVRRRPPPVSGALFERASAINNT